MTRSAATRSAARLCALALSLVVMVGCSSTADEEAGPTAPPPTTVADRTVLSLPEMRSRLAALDDLLTCDRRLEIVDDFYFWDRAVGVTCDRAGEEPTIVEVFRHPGSVETSLSEWAISETTPALVTSHTAVVGPPDVLNELRRSQPDACGAADLATAARS